jgi:hypothetical protein
MHHRTNLADHLSLALLVLALCLSGSNVHAVYASTCSEDPYGADDDGWEKGRNCEYDVSNLPAGTVRDKCVGALTAWDNKGCLNVNIQPDTAFTLTDITFYVGNAPGAPVRPGSSFRTTGFDSLVDDEDVYINYTNTTFYNQADGLYFPSAIKKVALHELGHAMGLDHGAHASTGGSWIGVSVMNGMSGINDTGNNIALSVTTCDLTRMSWNVQCLDACVDADPFTGACPGGGYTGNGDICCPMSPILLDINGDGYQMTDASDGVAFDFGGDGRADQVSWTSAASDDAWLVLDRNGNGSIDSGIELFGNLTPQPLGSERNGFLALAEYDTAGNGGNADGRIDNQDAIFQLLRLWQDVNHNGFSEATELHTCSDLNVTRFDLDYHTSRRNDEFGNRFRYRAKVYDAHGASVSRWAWDVFLVTP